MMQRHSIEDFIQAFGLRKKGREWVGACPICKEGNDRFTSRREKTVHYLDADSA